MSVHKSWAPEVFVDNQWSRNQVRYATKEEAERDAKDLYGRWTLTSDWRATPAEEPPNYRYENGVKTPISHQDGSEVTSK